MSLPLMPGTEPVQLNFAPPKPQAALPAEKYSAPWPNVTEGCQCPACRCLSNHRPFVQGAAAYGGTTSGRSSSAGPDTYPQGHPPGLIRGVYDFPHRDRALDGLVRWLNPDTGEVFASDGQRQWTFSPTADPDHWIDARRPGYSWRAQQAGVALGDTPQIVQGFYDAQARINRAFPPQEFMWFDPEPLPRGES